MKDTYTLRINGFKFQIINNWHEFKTEHWHLLSLYITRINSRIEVHICLLGFQLKIWKRNTKQ